jgi:molybdopterin-guanine dinucleotide biosynthesis protein A
MSALIAQDIAGCVVAGGLSRRMGEDKAFLKLGGDTLVARAVRRLGAQAAVLAINSNGDPASLSGLGRPVLGDVITGHPGPLAGVLTAMRWAGAQGREWVVTAAIDTPFFPDDLVARLAAAVRGNDLAVAISGGHRHPLFALWPVKLADDVRHALIDEDQRRVNAMIDRYRTGLAEWDTSPFDPFFNINNPEDLTAARRIMTEYDA